MDKKPQNLRLAKVMGMMEAEKDEGKELWGLQLKELMAKLAKNKGKGLTKANKASRRSNRRSRSGLRRSRTRTSRRY